MLAMQALQPSAELAIAWLGHRCKAGMRFCLRTQNALHSLSSPGTNPFNDAQGLAAFSTNNLFEPLRHVQVRCCKVTE